MALIEVKDLEKTYYNDGVATPVLRDVSFTINEGEFVAIMGPSGSGKSTLLHILGFLDEHTTGEYRFDGKTMNDYSKEEIAHVRNKKMGFVFQAFNLLPRTTVLENVKLPLLYSGIKKSMRDELALKAIESVGLSHRVHHESSQLSGGEKQRVAIARALVNKPNVIFADEPTGNLDSKSGQIVMEFIQKLNEEEGHTIILITHETYTAEHAQRIIHILDGKIESDKKVEHRHKARDHFKK
ncbi:MAG: macrolide ABC transporter ATP-binding protein [Candidatus Harrisonbacteria bacterium CG10_big_fil_rev_8_21_14_0_10_49_15]|uniref:Macrolide ABC transporter ATP-binding protein n=1 Tax=Candidatus Harrisonbacteria bacterium CG10_big_fil_rev_8_21_14_0_10_49_15 TaxID=1974587 RepID=A0A2H0UM18_9BACT|nr:MAG: macrolide ABC transporter ATP-binding protein [Candidatus Harrisonbacteria bacterium CG10_big_fil_rev_8_21_14_0_10_49_15]